MSWQRNAFLLLSLFEGNPPVIGQNASFDLLCESKQTVLQTLDFHVIWDTPSLNRSALECIYLQCATSALECVPSALNFKLVVCICTGGSALECVCNYLNEEDVLWECAGSALICICEVRWSALGVRSLAYLKCVGVCCSALGVRSLAYRECVGSALQCAGSAFISIPGVRWTFSGSHLAFSNCLLTLCSQVVELLSAQAFLGQLSFCTIKQSVWILVHCI